MAKQPHSCVDCGTRVPPQDDESALISMKYGWRLVRKVGDDGAAILEWRCPRCWTAYRESRSVSDTPPRRSGDT
jgi:hypothetical protein